MRSYHQIRSHDKVLRVRTDFQPMNLRNTIQPLTVLPHSRFFNESVHLAAVSPAEKVTRALQGAESIVGNPELAELALEYQERFRRSSSSIGFESQQSGPGPWLAGFGQGGE